MDRKQINAYSLEVALHHIAHLLDDLALVGCSHHGRSRDYHVGAGLGAALDGLRSHSTVHLDVQVGVVLAQPLHLGHHVGHEGLATEAGLHCHHQHNIRNAHVLLEIFDL